MKILFDQVSKTISKLITRTYSTSFSHGIYFLDARFHDAIYGIYGFVRLADEIVDSFHGFDKEYLLSRFREETQLALQHKISINPVLHSFQLAVHTYQIEWELIDTFLQSMEMDLHKSAHNKESYKKYIVGSAEVVGLMCLRVFTEGNTNFYEQLKPSAMKLGAAFQKVNFLRDLKADYTELGRTYFPNVDFTCFSEEDKRNIQTILKQILMKLSSELNVYHQRRERVFI